MEAIGRGKSKQAAGRRALLPVLAGLLEAGQRLVTLVRLAGRVRIEKRREIVRLDSLPDDVVLLGAGHFDDAQLRPAEMNAVAALDDARHLVLREVAAHARTAVVEPHQVAVLNDAEVGTRDSFPRRVGHEHHLAAFRGVQFQRGIFSGGDQPVVDEQLPARA